MNKNWIELASTWLCLGTIHLCAAEQRLSTSTIYNLTILHLRICNPPLVTASIFWFIPPSRPRPRHFAAHFAYNTLWTGKILSLSLQTDTLQIFYETKLELFSDGWKCSAQRLGVLVRTIMEATSWTERTSRYPRYSRYCRYSRYIWISSAGNNSLLNIHSNTPPPNQHSIETTGPDLQDNILNCSVQYYSYVYFEYHSIL